MNPDLKSINYWGKIGIVFIILFGTSLHFLYEWSGNWLPLTLIAAVNESVWEHLKLAFWPGLLWGVIECRFLKINKAKFWAIKSYALLIPSLFIPITFYAYTATFGSNYLAADISLFIIAVILAQICSMKLLLIDHHNKTFLFVGLVLLLLQLACFSLLTYFAPDHFLFIEERTGLRGIF